MDWPLLTTGLFPFLLLYFVFTPTCHFIGKTIGWRIRLSGKQRKELLIARASLERRQFDEQGNPQTSLDDEWEKVDRSRSHSSSGLKPANFEDEREWNGVIGFFHPFCNAGGGGERVLWAAIRSTQQTWPRALCAVYTGDHAIDKAQMIQRAKERFNIELYPPSLILLYLDTRHHVLASSWPHFTLLGQSIGSLLVAYNAFALLVPDIFIDTMGYAFTLAACKLLFPDVPTGAYVHYPTISTDMLGSLDAEQSDGKGLNAGTGKGMKGLVKRKYWYLFARLYGWVGGHVDVVMANSSWTRDHINHLWGPSRAGKKLTHSVEVVFPPCAVEELAQAVEVSASSEKTREPTLLYIAQFRPEKNHQLVLRAFARLLQTFDPLDTGSRGSKTHPQLVLVGSVRDSTDETSIYALRILARELHIQDSVTFQLNASWDTIMSYLRTSSIGINAMWNEHFGIGVVEYEAAGLISVVNDSGGPKNDIVIDEGDGPTGFHASTESEYAAAFKDALSLSPSDALAMRLRARKTAKRFNELAFEEQWLKHMSRLVHLKSNAKG